MDSTIIKSTYTVHTVGIIQDYISLYDNFTNSPATPSQKPLNEYLKTSSFIFIFIKNGKIVIDLNGTDYTIEKGHAITMTRNVVYNVKTVTEDYQYFIIVLNSSIINDAKLHLNINLVLLQIEKSGFVINTINNKHFDYIEHIYLNMLYWIKKQMHPYYHLIIKQFANIILINNVNSLGGRNKEELRNRKTAVSRQYVIFEHFIKLLEQHADKHRDVKFYANELDVTPKYLSAVTHVYTGKSAISSIEDFVINKIKSIMQERSYSIQQICKIMNFSSQSFFGRYFKRITGMSPREYIISINLY